jgi:hypothetical protein
MRYFLLLLLLALAGCEQPISKEQTLAASKGCTDAGLIPSVQSNGWGGTPTRVICTNPKYSK